MVLDGNMKNHRQVCLAQEAGCAEFNSLPGKVKTGCINTPQLKSRYCQAHTPTIFTPQENEDVSESTVLCAIPSQEKQLAYITNKKTTRQTTFHEVCCLKSISLW